MQTDVKKQYLLLEDKPVIYYALATFQESFIDEIILVSAPGEEEYCQKNIVDKYHFSKVTHIVAGGKERYHSVFQGLKAIDSCDYVFIHDGARPMVTQEILERAYVCVQEEEACVVGMKVKDTIKLADRNGYIAQTPNRDLMWTIQTPQTFSYSLIMEAYQRLMIEEEQLLQKGIKITDDAMVIETLLGHPVKLVEGAYENIKITTPEDLKIAEVIHKS